MSGVINIITKKGKKGEKHTTLTVQGGSYGTIQGTATTSGATDNWTYALGVTDAYNEGFPTYGYRINRPCLRSRREPADTRYETDAGRFGLRGADREVLMPPGRHSEARDRTATAARGTGSGRKLLSCRLYL